MQKSSSSLVFFIFVIAFLLRIIGINHGFPFIFHSDEPTVVRSALALRFDLNPGHFDWPHLYFYLNHGIYMIFAKFRDLLVSVNLKEFFVSYLPIIWNDSIVFYLITRLLNVLIGSLTIIPIYMISKELFSKRVGVLSALVFSIIPFHILRSHYTMTDIPMVFFSAWGIYFSAKIFNSGDLKNYIFSGLFIGLGASCKYDGGLIAFIVPLFHFGRVFWDRKLKSKKKENLLSLRSVYQFFISGVSCVFGFLIGTPYALFDFETFSRIDGPKGAFWQFSNVGSLEFGEHLLSFINNIFIKLPNDVGHTFFVIYLITMLLVLYRIFRKKFTKDELSLSILSILSVFLLWYVSGFAKSRSHYFLIAYPFIAVMCGWFVDELIQFVKKKNSILAMAFFFLVFIPPFVMSVLTTKNFFEDAKNWRKGIDTEFDVKIYGGVDSD